VEEGISHCVEGHHSSWNQLGERNKERVFWGNPGTIRLLGLENRIHKPQRQEQCWERGYFSQLLKDESASYKFKDFFYKNGKKKRIGKDNNNKGGGGKRD